MWGKIAISAAAMLLSPMVAMAASFDGTWSVVQVCDATKEGARGYTWRYDATITNSHLLGHRGTIPGGQSQFTLEGDLQADGGATLTGTGVSEASDYNIGFAQKGARILFRVAAKFTATQGVGDRLGVRHCKFTFTKHPAQSALSATPFVLSAPSSSSCPSTRPT
ncbi:MAG: hypothetical protein JSR91_14400 [Proteobacteria bacterium]|nr:hypothetical protein [Pseudomonadota bacterium]